MKLIGRKSGVVDPNKLGIRPPWFIALSIKMAETRLMAWVIRSPIRMLFVSIIAVSVWLVMVVFPFMEAIIYFSGGRSGAEAIKLVLGLLEAGAWSGLLFGLVCILLSRWVHKNAATGNKRK